MQMLLNDGLSRSAGDAICKLYMPVRNVLCCVVQFHLAALAELRKSFAKSAAADLILDRDAERDAPACINSHSLW
jgi:hypothetical protein